MVNKEQCLSWLQIEANAKVWWAVEFISGHTELLDYDLPRAMNLNTRAAI